MGICRNRDGDTEVEYAEQTLKRNIANQGTERANTGVGWMLGGRKGRKGGMEGGKKEGGRDGTEGRKEGRKAAGATSLRKTIPTQKGGETCSRRLLWEPWLLTASLAIQLQANQPILELSEVLTVRELGQKIEQPSGESE